MRRVKQFLSAIQAEITPYDEAFAAEYLNGVERQLFNQMNLPDRRHCLNVAYTALALSDRSAETHSKILVKAALLHDVGRRAGDVSTADKVLAVLCRALTGNKISAWGKRGRGNMLQNLRHAFYVSVHHPELGAELLRSAGVEEQVVKLVRLHHQPAAPDDSRELLILRKADDMN